MISHLVCMTTLFLGLSCLQPVRANAELGALMEMKASLDPENKILSSWTRDGDPCSGSFLGVGCNEHRKVGNISLPSRGLAGELSPAVAELRCLSGLYLQFNKLSGEIPREIGNLTELTDLYLDFNNFSGIIPSEIGRMVSLQVLQLNNNQLTGSIPQEIGFLKKLSYIALEHNMLTGQIPASFGTMALLKEVYFGFNQLSGPIPPSLASSPSLEVLDVQNNNFSGPISPGLQRLNGGGFKGGNNPNLCGVGVLSLRNCTALDYEGKVDPGEGLVPLAVNIPKAANVLSHCKHHCSSPSKSLILIIGVVSATISLLGMGICIAFVYRWRRQKVGTTGDESEDKRLNADQPKELPRNLTPLISLEYTQEWDPMTTTDATAKFNVEEVESAAQHFSDANLLGRSNFSAVYRGILKDGGVVAIKSINLTACKSEEAEFMKGLNLITSLKHDNLIKLRGFCCSKGRGECFLIYDYASRGTLSRYLDVGEGSGFVLNWPTRVSIIKGIARGIEYLHSCDDNKPAIVHRNISVEKILLDEQFSAVILDSGLLKLFAEDVVYSALKVSAALGYMAPEYITSGSFTEKSDVYAFGVVMLQVLSGKCMLTSSLRAAAESCDFVGFIDPNLKGKFNENEAAKLTKVAVACTNEVPENRPTMAAVNGELAGEGQNFVGRVGHDGFHEAV
ncbi:unnamed protein product [Cuscuta campestris]|uniref:Protein kinase domain-containing protein n=1 Tax=Cuscuta campestris TaxID=132261 RepID=A0A484MIA7_9ASTE|nr:unnamed protein product [Cuscuta campestris]